MAKNNGRNTKYKFLVEALKLFSEKGYKAVSVAEIANAVGCSAPALYKHYKSKHELLDAIIEESQEGFKRQMSEMNIDVESEDGFLRRIINMNEEEEIARLQSMVRYAVHNEFSQAFRKFCAIEQYHMPELAEIYTYRYLTFQYAQFEKLFEVMVKEGLLRDGNIKSMAKLYMSFPIIAIGMCDREPDKEDAVMEMIADHVREFNRSFRIR